MIRIAVVGEIGSGKTYVSNLFDLPVFNADKEVEKIYNSNRSAFKKLKSKLPKFIISFPIQKDYIKNAIRYNSKNIKLISSVIHPIVRKNMNEFLRKNKTKKAVVLDIPLYFENKLNKKKDVVIFISSQRKLIDLALKKRGKSSLKLLKKLGNLQKSLESKKKKSNYVIINDFKSTNLKKRVKNIKDRILNP